MKNAGEVCRRAASVAVIPAEGTPAVAATAATITKNLGSVPCFWDGCVAQVSLLKPGFYTTI